MMKYKPMLAYPVNNKPIDYSKNVYMQPKLDGVRCLIQYNKGKGKEPRVRAYSRTGKMWKNIDHILEELTPFFKNIQVSCLMVNYIIMILKTILSL